MTERAFLTLAEAVEIHKDLIGRYGGPMGVRDYGLLEAALAAPRATFDGRFLHSDVYEMAAAYLYHVCRDHPSVDGNKRAALACALVFLDINGIVIEDPEGMLLDLTIQVAAGQAGKPRIAEVLRRLDGRR